MRQYQKLLTLAAVAAAATLSGCASRQPASTAVVVVPPAQPSSVMQATSTIRTGTIVAIQETGAVGSAGAQDGSGATGASGTTFSEQLLTIQFDDGQRQQYRLGAGGEQFKVGDRVTVNTTQDTALITR